MSMTWRKLLGEEWWTRAEDLANRIHFISNNTTGIPSYPPRNLVFAAFTETPPDKCKVVILGQDPYHSPGKARGVAFGYHPTYQGSINSSMSNIMRECGAADVVVRVDWTALEHWTEQGVLLLNTRLTVPHERPMGHAGMGWEPLIREALQKIIQYRDPVILTWGAEARKFAQRTGSNRVVDTSHPCRYSASRGKKPFLGSECFWKVNEKLMCAEQVPIDWLGIIEEA